MFDALQKSFGNYPLQTVGLLIMIPTLFLLIYNAIYYKRNQVSRQLQMILNKDSNLTLTDKVFDFATGFLGKRVDKIQLKLERSNIPIRKNEYMTILIGGMVGGFALGFILFPLGPVFSGLFGWVGTPMLQLFLGRIADGVACAIAGMFVPDLFVQYRISKRTTMLSDQIEPALLAIADALRSGMNNQESFRRVGEDLKYPMGDEFLRAYQEMQVGKTFLTAIEDLKDRVDNRDFTMAMNAIQIQTETGASLEPLLRDMVKIITDRKLLKKEIDKAVTTSKSTGIVLMSAPALLIVLFSSMNKEGYADMLTTPLGLGMVIVGGVSYIIGAAIILSIIKKISRLST